MHPRSHSDARTNFDADAHRHSNAGAAYANPQSDAPAAYANSQSDALTHPHSVAHTYGRAATSAVGSPGTRKRCNGSADKPPHRRGDSA